MKLISCYIENFGGLSQYSLEFSEGITMIHAPNGSGKTTLAEFLRAMLYGFPRKGKTLEKSRRQKYAPWNGGQYGGNLVFELDGIRYRLERTFGATPKEDTFALIDLETGKKSRRFSENIGQELFQLDSDSFERSTYMPQIWERTSLSTTGIQTKLTCLVEDTGDINRYDKAIQKLRSRRTGFVPYRGGGGSVARATEQISRLQLELDRAQQQKSRLDACGAHIAETELNVRQARTQAEQLRRQWERASENCAQWRQREDLQNRLEICRQERRALETAYPRGIPDEEELTRIQQMAESRTVLEASGMTPREQQICEQLQSDWDPGLLEAERLESLAEQNREFLRCRAELDALTKTGGNKGGLLWIILGVLTLILGTVLPNVRLPLIVVGIILPVIGIFSVQTRRRTVERQKARVQKLQTDLRCQLGEGDFDRALAELWLCREKAFQWQTRKNCHQADLLELNDRLKEVFAPYGMTPAADLRHQLRQIYDDRRRLEAIRVQEDTLAQELARFPEMAVEETPERLKQALRHQEEELKELTEILLRQRQYHDGLRREAERIPELTEGLARWQSQRQAHQKKAELLDDTMEFLEKARENLTTSYLGPIRTHFDRYMTSLTDREERVLISPELDVQVERLGRSRELGYFSAGQTDLVMLCMRLALVDALFAHRKPFIILDDPFVNLDDATTAQARQLLKNLGRERQIIYLTCHESRSM